MIRFIQTALVALALAGPAVAAVEIQEVTSPGGFTAWLVEEHSIPFTALEIRFKGGSSLEAAEKRGAINLMTGLLEEGADGLDAQAFAAAKEALAAKFDYDVYDDSLSVSARFLTENRDQAIDLLRSSLIAPRFDQVAIDRVRAQVISGIRSDLTDPDDIASQTFDRLAFGDHPYGSSKSGTEASVMALSRDDIVDAHRRVMARDRIYVAAVGDITADQLKDLLDVLLSDLPATGAPFPPTAEILLTGGTTVVPFETPQSVAVFGHAGIDWRDPDYFAAFIMNHILGGQGFSDRLFREVRDKRGLTYGIGTYLASRDLASTMVGQFASANDRMAEAIAVIRDEWQRLAEGGVTDQELADAKTYLTGAYPLRFDGNSRIAQIMVGMQLSERPIDYIATRNDRVNAVTAEDVRRVAARLIDPEGLHFVVVGQPVGLEPGN